MFFLGIWIRKVSIKNQLWVFFVVRNCVPQLLLWKEGKKGGVSSQINEDLFFFVAIGEKILEINLPVKGLNNPFQEATIASFYEEYQQSFQKLAEQDNTRLEVPAFMYQNSKKVSIADLQGEMKQPQCEDSKSGSKVSTVNGLYLHYST